MCRSARISSSVPRQSVSVSSHHVAPAASYDASGCFQTKGLSPDDSQLRIT